MRPTSPRDPATPSPVSRRRPRRAPLVAIALSGLALGACGGEDDDDAPVEVLGTARVVEAPPVVEIEARTVLKSVPVNALPRPGVPAPDAPADAAEPSAAATGAVDAEPLPEPESAIDVEASAATEQTDPSPTEKPATPTAAVAGRSGESPPVTVATDVETVIVAPEATVADVEAVAAAAGAPVAAPVEADDVIAPTDITPSVPDATSDNPDWTSLVSDWTGSVELLRRRFGEDLDAEELLATGGERGQVVSIMENRMGIGREEAERRLDEFARSPEGP